MAETALQTYLQDHLAGSSGGVSLIKRLAAGSDDDAERAELERLVEAIEEDRDSLLELMERVGSSPSRIKNLGALVGDTLSVPKLRSSSPDGRLLKLEAMIMGVTGKRELWHSLLALGDTGDARLARHEVDRLRIRADAQLEALGRLHAQTAARVLRG